MDFAREDRSELDRHRPEREEERRDPALGLPEPSTPEIVQKPDHDQRRKQVDGHDAERRAGAEEHVGARVDAGRADRPVGPGVLGPETVDPVLDDVRREGRVGGRIRDGIDRDQQRPDDTEHERERERHGERGQGQGGHAVRILSWSMQDNMRTNLVLDALEMAYGRQSPSKGLLHHADRGSQYASVEYRQRLWAYGMIESMSRRGNCWDNAVIESFFHTLKTECVYQECFRTREQARKTIFDYIEVFYNRHRLHSSLGYLSPECYERQLYLKCA